MILHLLGFPLRSEAGECKTEVKKIILMGGVVCTSIRQKFCLVQPVAKILFGDQREKNSSPVALTASIIWAKNQAKIKT